LQTHLRLKKAYDFLSSLFIHLFISFRRILP